MDFEDADFDTVPPSFDHAKNAGRVAEPQGLNPGLIVLVLVGGLLLAFLVGNYALYVYAQKTLPPKKKKPISKKKLKREKLKQGRVSTRRVDSPSVHSLQINPLL